MSKFTVAHSVSEVSKAGWPRTTLTPSGLRNSLTGFQLKKTPMQTRPTVDSTDSPDRLRVRRCICHRVDDWRCPARQYLIAWAMTQGWLCIEHGKLRSNWCACRQHRIREDIHLHVPELIALAGVAEGYR